MRELNEECGIIALYHLAGGEASPLCPSQGRNEVSRLAPRMLLDLQNRGQLSTGITTYHPNSKRLLSTYKDNGTVSEVFHVGKRDRYNQIMDEHAAYAAIGHTRYAAGGQEDRSNAQPFERHHIKKHKWFSIVFNGQLANYNELKKQLLSDHDTHLSHETDTEIIMHYLCSALKEEKHDLLTVCQKMSSRLDGSYCLAYLNALGQMFVARDPLGIKPLLYAFDGSLFAAASESVALFNLGFPEESIKNVAPGEIIMIDENGIKFERFAESTRSAHCFFEWGYFANVASTLDGKSVYLARKHLGEELALQEDLPLDNDCIVVPVPDTSKAAADGMAYALKIPCLEGLIRNRYTGRTFIEGYVSRWRRAETKYTPLREVLENKRVFLVEDSIVRSTTMRVLIERIRKVGKAREINVRVACAPIIAPCFYGVDMSTYSELFASRFFLKDGKEPASWVLTREMEAEMCADIGADTLRFLPVDAISRAIGLPKNHLCEACINNEYPTPGGCHMAQLAKEKYLNDLKSQDQK